jgi:hypothetical protein
MKLVKIGSGSCHIRGAPANNGSIHVNVVIRPGQQIIRDLAQRG